MAIIGKWLVDSGQWAAVGGQWATEGGSGQQRVSVGSRG